MKITFTNAHGQSLAGRLELPESGSSTAPLAYALFAHCFTCSKDIAAASRISRALSARGIAVLRFDFTGLGNSDGDFANTNFTSNVQDLVAAADFLRTEFEAPSLLVGHSLGGAAVLVAGARIPEVKAVAAIAAPSAPQHVRNLLKDQTAEIEREGSAEVVLAGRTFRISRQFLDDLDEQSLARDIRTLRKPLMILHSPVDEIVGIDHARQIYEAALHPKSFISLDRADHLLSRKEDSEFVSDILAAWASRYLEIEADVAPTATAPEGHVRVEELSGLTQRISAGRHVLMADEPASVGGSDLGPTPYDLLLSALGACTTMTLRMYARHKGWPLEKVAVDLRHEKIHAKDCEECEKESGKVDRIERELELSGPLDADQRQRLLEIADRCPVHRTLMEEKQILTRLLD